MENFLLKEVKLDIAKHDMYNCIDRGMLIEATYYALLLKGGICYE